MTFAHPTTRTYQAKLKSLPFHSVTLIGWAAPGPARYGDNRGIWPVRIATGKREEDAVRELQRHTPHIPCARLECVLVESDAHAKKLKSALDEMLIGAQDAADNSALYNDRFADVLGCWEPIECEAARHQWWCELLTDAKRLILESRSATRMNTYDPDAVYRRIAAGVKPRLTG